MDLGYTVYFYGIEGSEVPCTEFIQVVSKEEWEKEYGNRDPNKTYPYNPNGPTYQTFNRNAVKEINLRKQEKDILAVTLGNFQKPIADEVQIALTVEIGVGYEGTFAKYRTYESYAWMHFLAGIQGGYQANGDFYHTVIPYAIDPEDYTFKEKKEDYYLYLGRVIKRKGVDIAIQTTKAIGARLIVAGQKDNDEVDLSDVEYVGYADLEKRKELLANARAVFVPTMYFEPFGAVVVEAGMSGTPVLTTDFGAFTETVVNGKNGFRCSTLKDFILATKNLENITPLICHAHSMKYNPKNLQVNYGAYFLRLQDLFGNGWLTT
jgi:glycosyltransferase involved in cell wall biosynthesis